MPLLPGQALGLVAQLFGTIATPQLKVGIRVRWRIRESSGRELKDGEDFVATQGLTSPNLNMLLVPPFREARIDSLLKPGGTALCLTVEVELRLGLETRTFILGPVPLVAVPLLIPTIVVLFTEENFGLTRDGAALVVVPEHSPFSSAESLFKTLRRLETAVDALRSLGGLVSFFLGLDELLGVVPEMPRLRFATTRVDPDDPNQVDGIPELEAYTIKRRPWYHFLGSDPNFDDKVASLLVFGLPGTKVGFFNDEFYRQPADTKQGNFQIELRSDPLNSQTLPLLDFFVGVRTLNTSNDRAPVTFPEGRATFDPDTTGNDVWFQDLSSLGFSSAWLTDVAAEGMAKSIDIVPDCKRVKPPLNLRPGSSLEGVAETVEGLAQAGPANRSGGSRTNER